MLGREAGRHGVLYLPAGEPHDMENPGAEPARYVVFEFHAARRRPEPPAAQGRPAEDLAAERDRLARELHTVLTSSSWRLTAPLRRAVAAVRAARR